MDLVIDGCGVVRCLYTESVDFASLGLAAVRRASHVEPDDSGMWHADLAPSGGPVLGPFGKRSEALAAEAAWLEAHALG